MQRNLTFRYVFGGEKLETYERIKNLPSFQIDGWMCKISHMWAHVMTLEIYYSNYGSGHHIDLPKLFKDHIESFEKHQLLNFLQTAEIKQIYKSSFTTYSLPVNVNVDEANRIADNLNKTAHDEDSSCFYCLFGCIFNKNKTD
jgi:hypothetical protein